MRCNPHGGDIYSDTIEHDFSVNVNPLGPPDSVKKAVEASLSHLACYPDVNARELTRATAEKEQVPEEDLLFGNGAAELIFAIVRAVRPRKALLAVPTFLEYEAALLSEGCFIRYYGLKKEENFQFSKDFLDSLTEDLDLVFLCNPNNPTGLVLTREQIRSIAKVCEEKDILLVVDECFVEFVSDPESVTAKPLLKEFPSLIILRAFTKTYAIPALRLGYLLCEREELVQKISSCLPSWNVSLPAQMAGIAALSEREYLEKARKLLFSERPYLKKELEKMGMKVWDSAANYLFFEGPPGLSERLKKGGILIRDCSNYPGLCEGYYRTAVRRREENQMLLHALREIMKWL